MQPGSYNALGPLREAGTTMNQRTPRPAEPAPQLPRFWHRLNTFFLFPLQSQPLTYGGMLALCSLLILLLPTPLVAIVTELGILLAASRYGFKVTALGSRGIYRASDFTVHYDEDWKNLPWKLFALLVLQSMAAGWLGSVRPVLGQLAVLAISFLLPASLMVLVQTGSLRATLNPANAWAAVQVVGWPYVLLCFFLFLLSEGSVLAMAMLAPIFPEWLLLPLINWVLIYFGWVMCSLLGYVMYQNHEAFGIDLLPGAGIDTQPPDRRTPQQIEHDATDALVAQKVTEGDLEGALGIAYEHQRTRHDELPAQRRYHRILALANKTPTLLDHAQRFIPQLLRLGQNAEALRVCQTCRAQDAKFVLADADPTLALARTAWGVGDAALTLALLGGFDRRFKGHASVPQAYELAARALLQGMGRADMALKVLATLEARHPNDAATQEARWLLRQHLPPAPSTA